MPLSLQDIVDVDITITSTIPLGTEHGRVLLLTRDPDLDGTGSGKSKSYATLRALEMDFDPTSQAFIAARDTYFRQDPFPQPLTVGRWVESAQDPQFIGTAPDTISTITAIVSGSLTFQGFTAATIDFSLATSYADVGTTIQAAMRVAGPAQNARLTGTAPDTLANLQAITAGSVTFQGETATALNFSAAADFAAVAVALQAALQTLPGLNLATVAYATNVFVVEVPGADVVIEAPFTGTSAMALGLDDGTITQYSANLSAVTVEYANLAFRVTLAGSTATISGPFTGTSASALGLDMGQTRPYAPVEGIVEGVQAIMSTNNNWSTVTLESGIEETMAAATLAAWIESQQGKMLLLRSSDEQALVPNDTTSFAALRSESEYERTAILGATGTDYRTLSLGAALSTIRLDRRDTFRTAKFFFLPGITPDLLDAAGTQRAELDRKRINYYVPLSNTSIVAEGVMLAPNIWIDTQYWSDWFATTLQTRLFNLLASIRSVSQDLAGMARIKDTCETVCELGVANGGISQTATTNAEIRASIQQVTGNIDFDGRLPDGYLVYVDSIATQPIADYNARLAPTIYIWANYAGAVHSLRIRASI